MFTEMPVVILFFFFYKQYEVNRPKKPFMSNHQSNVIQYTQLTLKFHFYQ